MLWVNDDLDELINQNWFGDYSSRLIPFFENPNEELSSYLQQRFFGIRTEWHITL